MGQLDKLYFQGLEEMKNGDWSLHLDSESMVERYCSTSFYSDEQYYYDILKDSVLSYYDEKKEESDAYFKDIDHANTGDVHKLAPILLTGVAVKCHNNDEGDFVFTLLSMDKERKETIIQVTCKKELRSRFSIFERDYIEELMHIQSKRVIVALSHILPASGFTKDEAYKDVLIANCMDIDISDGKYYDADNIRSDIEGHQYVYCDENFKIHQAKDFFKQYNAHRKELAQNTTSDRYSKESINRTINSSGCLSAVCAMLVFMLACVFVICII